MSITLGKNLISLGANRLLTERAQEVRSVFERLSTGLRINSASDDPAGLHISSELESSSRVFTQALRNVSDAQSLVSVMEDALKEMTNIAERQKELAQQAASETLTARQRSLLHAEANALADEMNRILRSVEFNGMKVFDENNGTLNVHAGGTGDNIVAFELGRELLQTVGDGTFQPQVSLGVGLDPNSIVTGDFNNDGIIDIATANFTDDSISILLGNGDGSFQAEIVNFTGDGPNSLRAGDFNNDGILDLAHNNYGDSGLGDTVSILLGAGDGTFTEVSTVQTGLGPTSLDIGDIDNDGILDVTAAVSSINFVSGLPETTRIDTQDNGRYEVTDVVMVDAAVQEETTITAIDGDTSIAEESTVTASGIGEREITEVTMADADSSIAEVTDITASDIGEREITDFTMVAADNSVAEETEITMSAIGERESTDITMEAGSNITTGDYFTIDSADAAYYVWYNVDGGGADPLIGGRTGIEVAINSTDSADDVATKTAAALDGVSGFTASATTDTVTVTNDALGAVADVADGNIGGAFAANVTTQGTDSDIMEGSYFTLETTAGSYYVWFDINNTGVDPTPGGTGIEVDVNYGDSADTVAAAVQAAIDAQGAFSASVSTDTVTVTNAVTGAVADATAGNIAGGTFAVNTSVQGADSDLQSGDYFLLETRDTQYYVWYNIDGAGGDPGVAGRTGIEVAVTASDSADDVAAKTAAAIDLVGDLSASASTDTVSVTNATIGAVADGSDGTIGGAFAVNVTTQGSDSDIVENSYFTLDVAGTSYYAWFNIDGTGVDPTPGGTGIEINVSAGDSANTVAAAIQAAIDAEGDFGATVVGDVVTVTNATTGASADATTGTITGSTFAVTTTTQGADTLLQSGDYFTASSGGTNYYIWYNVDGAGGDPTPGGIGIEVAINGTDTAAQIATKTAAAVDANGAFSASALGDVVTIANATIGTATDIADGNVGGAFSVNVTTQGTNSDIVEGSYFTLDTPGTDYYVWFNIDGTSTDPSVAGRTGIQVNVSAGDDANTVAAAIQAAVNAQADFSASVLGDEVTITNTTTGPSANITSGNISGGTFAVATTTNGAVSDILSGDYFFLSSSTTNYYVWLNVDGAGGDPTIGGRTGIEVAINSTDNADTVATKIRNAINAEAEFTASVVGDTVTVTNVTGGIATNASDQTVGGAFSVTTTTNGTNSIIENGDYFTIDTVGDDYYVWFNFGGAVDPSIGGRTGIEIAANYGDSAATLAALVDAALDAQPDFNGSVIGNTVRITGTNLADSSAAAGTITGLSVTTVVDGYAPVILSGQYFELDSTTDSYYVWYNVDGGGGDPGVAGRTGIQVNISDGDTAASIALATAAAINARPELNASASTNRVTVVDLNNGPVLDATNITVGGTFAVNTTQQGTSTRVDTVLEEVFAPGHNLTTGAAVTLTTNGTLPGGLSTATTYYVIAVDDDTLAFATSLANALSDTRIDLTTFGSGTHSIIPLNAGDSGGVSLGNGDGTFGSTVPFQAGTQPQDFRLVDVNLDGRLDLLVAEGFDGTLAVQLGTGSGFAAAVSYNVGASPTDIEAGDFNGDGFVDIATLASGSNQVTILMGDGTGNFGSAQNVTLSGTGASRLTLGDINGDGRDDIITTDYNGGAGTGGTLLINDGNGTFTNAGTYTAGLGAIDARVADFNGDGAADIAVVNETDGSVGILFGNTEGSLDLPAVNLLSVESARASLSTVTDTLSRLTSELGAVGAAASRLQFMGSYILGQRDQFDAARSRITDIDVANEVAELVRLQILQQATTSILAQANLETGVALQLIQNVNKS